MGVLLATVVAVGASQALASGARAAEPIRVTPPKMSRKERRAERKTKDMSEAGTKRGVLELTLGSVVAAGVVALVGRGIWELVEGQTLEDECSSFTSEAPECGAPDPAQGNKIGAGLSFGFAVPMAIAAGFLLARGARIHRDYKAYNRAHPPELSVIPRAGRQGGGLTLRLRF